MSLLIQAQKLKFDNYTSRDGLISDDVYKMFQDSKGYLWVFTDYGVMKYNGKSFEQTLKNLPFSESFIYAYYVNSKGQIWIANSNANIYEIKNDSAFIIKGLESFSEKHRKSVAEIYQLYVDDSLNIYTVSKQYTFKFIKNNKIYKGIQLNERITSDSIIYKVICRQENLLPILFQLNAKPLGGFFLNHDKIKIQILNCDNKVEIVDIPGSVLTGPKLFKKYNNEIYINDYNKIIKINTNFDVVEVSLNAVITSFIKDKNNHLWVGCVNDGVYEIDEQNHIINHYLIDKTVNEVYIDDFNNLWISTEDYGIFNCKGSNTFFFDKTEPLGMPISIIKKIDHELFIFNNHGDLYTIEDNTIKSTRRSIDIKTKPFDICKYHSNYIISYPHKTEYLDSHKKIIKKIVPQDNNFFVPYKYYNIDNDTLLLVKRHSLMRVFNDSVIENVEFNFKIYDCVLKGDKILIGSDDGIYEYSNKTLSRPDYLNISKNKVISKIVKGKLGEIWFCSKGYGLYKLTNDNKLFHYTIHNGLPSNIINDISFNVNHSILLSTNIGLFLSSKYKTWVSIYPEQVQQAVEFENKIYFSTKDGLIITDKINQNETLPIYFNLSEILVNNIKKSIYNFSSLKYDQNNIEFRFDIITGLYSMSEIVYHLKGEKNYSGTSKDYQLTFQNLPPGSYTLTAALSQNNIKSSQIIIPFNICPVFWQTSWFKVLFIIIVFAFVFFISWALLKYYKNKISKKQELNKLLMEYKLIALKAQINPHFMSNCLTAIQHLILSGRVDEANQYLARFSLLVRQVLNFSSKSLVTLNEELEITELNIELEQLRFENKFEYEIEIEDNAKLNQVLVPPLILQPIVENAIWHGLLPIKKVRVGILKILISSRNDILYIVIEDNGIGRSNKIKVIGNIKESKGIQITRQRIQNLNNSYNITNADLIYEDLKDDYGNPLGTRVTIVLPMFIENNE